MEQRAKKYKYATDNYLDCMKQEFTTACKYLDLFENCNFVNFGAGGIPIHIFTNININYLPIENNPSFAELYNYPLCQNYTLNFNKNSIDRILVLASFHHASINERITFYKSAIDVLKKNGKLIISDVVAGSIQDKWLNCFVNKYNSLGHNGVFFTEKDSSLMHECGFNNILIQTTNYSWKFTSEEQMVDFFKNLFNLDLADDQTILDGVKEYFGNTLIIPWSLVYFILSP